MYRSARMMVPVTTREWLRRTFFALTGVNLFQIRIYEKIDNNQGRNEILDRKLSKWSAGNDLGMERLTGCLPIVGSSILDWVKSRSKTSTFPGFVTRQENRSIMASYRRWSRRTSAAPTSIWSEVAPRLQSAWCWDMRSQAIIEIGSDVEYHKIGDLVSVPFNVACGAAAIVARTTPVSA